MFSRLTIENYRGIAKGTLEGLAPLTVLVGANNSGKSSVLESLLLAASQSSPKAVEIALKRRGWVGLAGVNSWLRGVAANFAVTERRVDRMDTEQTTKVSFDPETSQVRVSRFGGSDIAVVPIQESAPAVGSIHPVPSLIEVDTAAEHPDSLETAFSQADLEGRRQVLIDLLRPLLPGLIDLRILVPGPRPTLYVEDENGRWPAAAGGDGFKRLLLLATRIAADKSGLVLVEEPECHLHVGALKQVARLFWEATAGKTQVVAATHSLELLDAIFLNATEEELNRSSVLRLSLQQGKLTSVCVPGKKVQELRAEIGEDLRR